MTPPETFAQRRARLESTVRSEIHCRGLRLEPFGAAWRGAERVARCRDLIAKHAQLIPPGRMKALEADLAHWSTPNGNGW